MLSLCIRASAVWLLLLIAAVINGAVRQAFLVRALGELAGHVLSTLMLSILIFMIAWLLSAWLGIASAREAWLVGILWLIQTIAFEFLAGHFLFGAPWSKLVADYDLTRGRIWILVLVVTATAPWLIFRIRR